MFILPKKQTVKAFNLIEYHSNKCRNGISEIQSLIKYLQHV